MTKSQLIERIAREQSHLVERDVALAVNTMLEHMTAWLAGGGRVENRGFGSFSQRYRRARIARNPRTGTPVSIGVRYAPRFKRGDYARTENEVARDDRRRHIRRCTRGNDGGLQPVSAASRRQ